MLEISDNLYSRLLEIQQDAAVAILLRALDEMQGYNGQSQQEAICTVIGAKHTDNGWLVPSVTALNEAFA